MFLPIWNFPTFAFLLFLMEVRLNEKIVRLLSISVFSLPLSFFFFLFLSPPSQYLSFFIFLYTKCGEMFANYRTLSWGSHLSKIDLTLFFVYLNYYIFNHVWQKQRGGGEEDKNGKLISNLFAWAKLWVEIINNLAIKIKWI